MQLPLYRALIYVIGVQAQTCILSIMQFPTSCITLTDFLALDKAYKKILSE